MQCDMRAMRAGFYNFLSIHEVTADEVVGELLRGGVPEECITQALVDDIRLQDLTVERVLQHFKARKEAEFEAIIEKYFLNDAYLVSTRVANPDPLNPAALITAVFSFVFFQILFQASQEFYDATAPGAAEREVAPEERVSLDDPMKLLKKFST